MRHEFNLKIVIGLVAVLVLYLKYIIHLLSRVVNHNYCIYFHISTLVDFDNKISNYENCLNELLH